MLRIAIIIIITFEIIIPIILYDSYAYNYYVIITRPPAWSSGVGSQTPDPGVQMQTAALAANSWFAIERCGTPTDKRECTLPLAAVAEPCAPGASSHTT